LGKRQRSRGERIAFYFSCAPLPPMLKVSKVKKGDCNKFGIVLLEAGNMIMKP